jgi:glycosyltransferase involved in cell wall biosynthesis
MAHFAKAPLATDRRVSAKVACTASKAWSWRSESDRAPTRVEAFWSFREDLREGSCASTRGALNVESRVTFHEPLQRRLWELIRAFDAFVFPTLKQGGCYAALEAAALGLPVVVFDPGGPATARFYRQARFEVIPGEESHAAIATALEQLALDAGADAAADDLTCVYARVRTIVSSASATTSSSISQS